MSEIVNLADWKARVNAEDGVRRMLDLAVAIPPESPNVWAEAQTLYEVTARLSALFRSAGNKPNRAETLAETEMRETCLSAADELADVCRSIESAWISAYAIPSTKTADETTNLRSAA